ncbi:MAG: hypothetical protein HC845_09695 [Akkermansiaceae bacterium]|nr:hypothetical protein [Akkermansiaceae bacterium]
MVEESTKQFRFSSRTETPSTEELRKKAPNRMTSAEGTPRMPKNTSRVQALLDFYATLSAEELAEEAKKLEGLPLGERITSSILLFSRWAETDPTAAMAFSNTMGMAGGFVKPTILQNWASVDPAGAAKYLADNPREFAMMDMMGGRGGAGGQSPFSIIASEWARKDPAAALTWANSLTMGKEAALSTIIGEMAKTDPAKAKEWLVNLNPTERAGAYRSLATQYGANDFVAAEAWVRTLPAEDQAEALAAAIGGLAKSNPAAAAQKIATMPAGNAKNRLIPEVVQSLARIDALAAADFLKKQENEDVQSDGMRQLMPSMVAKDPAAAYAYANSFPDGKARDSAIQSYIWANNKAAPADLFIAAETITDEGDRNRAAGVAAMRWLREDPEAAKKGIAASTALSDETKKQISQGRGGFGGGFRGRN